MKRNFKVDDRGPRIVSCKKETTLEFAPEISSNTIDIERHKNRLLKFCYVPLTSAACNRLLFSLQPFTVLMKQTRQAVRAIKQSIFLDVYEQY
jgi:hypothetical protein